MRMGLAPKTRRPRDERVEHYLLRCVIPNFAPRSPFSGIRTMVARPIIVKSFGFFSVRVYLHGTVAAESGEGHVG